MYKQNTVCLSNEILLSVNEVLTHVATWMKLEDMLHARTQSPRATMCDSICPEREIYIDKKKGSRVQWAERVV
jgi:hypothetical protein